MNRPVTPALALLSVLVLVLGCTADPSPSGPDEQGRKQARSQFLDLPEPEATPCTGTLGAVEVDGDLLVPRDRTCQLNGTAIGGRVIVSMHASLLARDARFGEGISAHSFRRVELRGGRVKGRPRSWAYSNDAEQSKEVDFVFDGGRDVIVHEGPTNGQYYFLGNWGKVEIVGLYLDLGSIFCAENRRRPVVRGISAESPGVLGGQCAGGGKAFGDTDF